MKKIVLLSIVILCYTSKSLAQSSFVMKWSNNTVINGRIFERGAELKDIGGYFNLGKTNDGKKRKLGKHGIGFVIRIINANGKREGVEYGFVNFLKNNNAKEGYAIGDFTIPKHIPKSYTLPKGSSYYLCMVGHASSKNGKEQFYMTQPKPLGVKIIIN